MKKQVLPVLVAAALLSTGCAESAVETAATEYAEDTQTKTETAVTEAEGTESREENKTGDAAETEAEMQDNTEDEADVKAEMTTGEVSYPEIISDGELKSYADNGDVVIDQTAYELYTYVDGVAESYAEAINSAAEALSGTADVYNIVIPTSSGITLPDNFKDEVDSSDQRLSLDKIYAKMQEQVHEVDIYDNLMKHRTEYLYFRSDHHWTALGAYYAYETFCEAKGIESEALSDYETVEFEGFVGSLYSETEDAALKENPDTVVAYYPNCESEMTVTSDDGITYTRNVIGDVSESKSGSKYMTFIGGDNPYSVIENKELADESACIVVKESFGNAFVPFLVDHYRYIYVIDYRYWSGTLSDLVSKTGATDVIMINNISMTRNKYLVGKLKGISK